MELARRKNELRHREMIVAATLVVVAGSILGYFGMHGIGITVEVTGLLLVSLI